MANNKYTLAAIGATFQPSKHMISLYNSTGSGAVLKVWKIWVLNNQSVAITGVQSEFLLNLITSIGGGAALTPLKHNSSISALSSKIIAAEGATCLSPKVLRRVIWSTDEPVATAATVNVVETIPSWNCIWDTSIAQTTLEPIVLNEGEGVSVFFNTASSVGQADFFMEFTSS